MGGVFFRVAERLFFLPATIASKVLPMPGVAHVPGAPADLVGVALVQGEMIPVVSLSALEPPALAHARTDHRPMLLCNYLGERVGLVGCEIVATGRFDSPAPEHEGVRAELFDVGAVFDGLRAGRWAV